MLSFGRRNNSREQEYRQRVRNLEYAFKFPGSAHKDGLGELFDRVSFMTEHRRDVQQRDRAKLDALLDYLNLDVEYVPQAQAAWVIKPRPKK